MSSNGYYAARSDLVPSTWQVRRTVTPERSNFDRVVIAGITESQARRITEILNENGEQFNGMR